MTKTVEEMSLHNRTRIEMLMLASPIVTQSVRVNLYQNQKLHAVYSKSVTPDSKDVKDKEPCQDYWTPHTLRFCVWHTHPLALAGQTVPLEPAWSEELTSPISSKMRGGWLCTESSPMLAVMSRDEGKRHHHHHKVREGVGDQADPTP